MVDKRSYYSTGFYEECYKTLEFVEARLIDCKEDSYNWKWVIIGFHNSLQNFLVQAITDSTQTNILKKQHREKQYNAIANGDMYEPKSELNYFVDLYKDMKKYEMLRGKYFIPENNDDQNILKLNNLRNKFLHFIPTFLSYHIKDFIFIFFTPVRIMQFLLTESDNIVILMNPKDKERANKLLESIKELLKYFENNYCRDNHSNSMGSNS